MRGRDEGEHLSESERNPSVPRCYIVGVTLCYGLNTTCSRHNVISEHFVSE